MLITHTKNKKQRNKKQTDGDQVPIQAFHQVIEQPIVWLFVFKSTLLLVAANIQVCFIDVTKQGPKRDAKLHLYPANNLSSNRAYLKWRTGYSYPQNVLRNLARQTSITHYTLSLGEHYSISWITQFSTKSTKITIMTLPLFCNGHANIHQAYSIGLGFCPCFSQCHGVF